MKRNLIAVGLSLVVCACFAVARADAAVAGPLPDARALFHEARARLDDSEWLGVYAIVDSFYDCEGNFLSTITLGDTICTFAQADPGGIPLSCTGTVTPTSVDLVCDARGPILPGCDALYHAVIQGTIASGEYFMVTVNTVTFEGTGSGCENFPPSCTRVVTHGVRTGPPPVKYCETATRPTTWGRIKTMYR